MFRQKIKFLIKLLSFLVWILALEAGSYAAIDLSNIGMGARPLSLGRAYVALADDASAIFINPAGLSRNSQLNFISMAGSILQDVNYCMVGVDEMTPLGKFGIGYINSSVSSIPMTTIEGVGASMEVKLRTDNPFADYSSSMVFFSYGSKLSRVFRNGSGDNVSLGASLKMFLQGFSGGGTPMQNAAGNGMDADFGLLWDINSWASLGVNFQNFLPASLGGRFIWKTSPNEPEAIPLVIHAGGRFRIIGNSALRRQSDQQLDLMIDYENNSDANVPSAIHAGLEFWPVETLALRVGIDQKPKATETGAGVDNNLSAGVGLLLSGFTFDYAYHQYGELKENATHFFSIGYRGGAKKNREKKTSEMKNYGVSLEVVPKPKLQVFSDVPENYWARRPIEYLATLKIMNGYNDGTFRPGNGITRGELAVLLVKAKGFDVEKKIKIHFSDVPSKNPQAPYISMAVERKYVKGFPNGYFRPDRQVTRSEAAAILANFSGFYVKPKASQKPFFDVPASHWAASAIAVDKEHGYFEYLSGKAFGPEEFLTRAEAAEIISKTSFAKKQIEKLISGEEK